MGATQNDSVNQRVAGEEFGEVFLHEIVGTCMEVFACFNQGYPHRTCLLGDNEGRVLLEQFNDITLRCYGARGGEYANMFGARALWNDFYRGADHA